MNKEVVTPLPSTTPEAADKSPTWYDTNVHLCVAVLAIIVAMFNAWCVYRALLGFDALEVSANVSPTVGRVKLVLLGASIVGLLMCLFAASTAALLHFDGKAYPEFGRTRLQKDSTIIAWTLLGAGVGGVLVKVINLTVDQRYGAGPALSELAHWALLVGGIGGLVVKATLFITPALKAAAAARKKNSTSAEPTAP